MVVVVLFLYASNFTDFVFNITLQVRIFDVTSADLTDGDVLILATDGLWDITSNEKAVATVVKSLSHFPAEDQNKYKYR